MRSAIHAGRFGSSATRFPLSRGDNSDAQTLLCTFVRVCFPKDALLAVDGTVEMDAIGGHFQYLGLQYPMNGSGYLSERNPSSNGVDETA